MPATDIQPTRFRKKLKDNRLSPKDFLLPYQRTWVNTTDRFKFALWARQSGKDFSTQAEVVEDCVITPGTQWLIASAGERQAVEAINKAKMWAKAYKLIIDQYDETRDAANALLKNAEIVFSNGSRIVAVPASPDTVRGYSANVVFTEFSTIEKVDEVWRAVYPSITNPLTGLKKVRIVTTPKGKKGMAYKIWHSTSAWYRNKVTVWDAIKGGLNLNAEEIRDAMQDDDGWAQEYECEWIDDSSTLLPYDLIALAESPTATEAVDPEFFRAGLSKVYCGIDFGRQNDPTVCWTLEKNGDTYTTKEVLRLKKVDTPAQREILSVRVARSDVTCVDYTGAGIGLGDYLVKYHDQYLPKQHKFGKVELCTFTPDLKRKIFPRLRKRLEAPTTIRIPKSVWIREDLHQMEQHVTASGFTYKSPRTSEGHSDACTALALANRAIEEAEGKVEVYAVLI